MLAFVCLFVTGILFFPCKFKGSGEMLIKSVNHFAKNISKQ